MHIHAGDWPRWALHMFMSKRTVLFPLSLQKWCVHNSTPHKEMQNPLHYEYGMMCVWLPTPGVEVTANGH